MCDGPGGARRHGRLAQTLQDFEDAVSLVPKETIAASVTCGPDADKHVAQLKAGADEIYVQQIGPDLDGFFTAYGKDVLPALRG